MAATQKRTASKFYTKTVVCISICLASLLFSSSCRNQTLNGGIQTNSNNNTEKLASKNVMLDGKPFFPFGFYYHSTNPQERMDALNDIGAAGFNTMFVFWENIDNYGTFLDRAQQLGVRVITELKGSSHIEQIVKPYKDKPAVFGWGLTDDAGDHESSSEILDFHQQVKATDPDSSTYISISGWSKKWAEFSHVADIIGGQSYPIGYPYGNSPEGLPNALSEVYYVFNLGRTEANKYDRPVIANLQTFSWPEQRWPTPKEVRNMTYQALLSGVKGIIFYTYKDQYDRIKEQPYIWQRAKSMVPEINKLTPVLLKGTLTNLNTGSKELIAGQWTYGNSVYVVVLSTSSKETKQVSIPILEKVAGSVKPLFSGRPSGMALQSGKLSGSIKPQDVHVYQLLKN